MWTLIGHLDLCVCVCVCEVINDREALIYPVRVHSKGQNRSSFNKIMRQLMHDPAIWSVFLVHLNRITIVRQLELISSKWRERERGRWHFFAGKRAGSITSKFTLCSRVARNMEEMIYHMKYCTLEISIMAQPWLRMSPGKNHALI